MPHSPARRDPVVAVVGAGVADEDDRAAAHRIGHALAAAGATIVCGGLGGVMEAACAGAVEAGETTVGLLPGSARGDANPHVQVAIPTGLGEARNTLVVRAADVVVAVGGEYGTLSEIAFALKVGVPVVGLGTWQLVRRDEVDEGIVVATDADDAVARVLALLGRRR